jgi:ribonuclease HII
MVAKSSVLEQLLEFDRVLFSRHVEMSCSGNEQRFLVGVDEVGRGSMIASVVAGAVAFPCFNLSEDQKKALFHLNDSKQLSHQQRKPLAQSVTECCMVALGEASQEEVDQLNVHQASLLALSRAVWQLCQQFNILERQLLVLIDGCFLLPGFPASQQVAVVKGDTQSASIAAASVVAKETRDTMVRNLAERFPGYGWESNMGYPTAAHRKAIQTWGVTPYHRRRFLPVELACTTGSLL